MAYYEFRASLCHNENVDNESESRRTATTDKIKELFGQHSVERTVDMTNADAISMAQRKTQQKEARRESRLGASQGAGEKHACESDLSKCMDYSMDASGRNASFSP